MKTRRERSTWTLNLRDRHWVLRRYRRRLAVSALSLMAAVVPLGGSILRTSLAEASDWVFGDVFAAVGSGKYQVYSNSGVFKETITDGLGGDFTDGCFYNPAVNKL